MKESTNHAHVWGAAQEILYGDVWTKKSCCLCGAIRLVHPWGGKTIEEVRLPSTAP